MSKAWDRLADASRQSEAKLLLSIVAIGHVHTEEIATLTPHFARIEQLVLEVEPRSPLRAHRAEFNRAIDAATADWVLIVREHETIDEALAAEVATAAVEGKARGFRVRSVPFYAGEPLRIGVDEGEVRLFHRRYYLRYANKGEWDELMIQGPVVRLSNAFRSVTFGSVDEHRTYLADRAAPHSMLRRVLLFGSYVLGARTLDRNTLRYLWVEAGFDVPPSL